MIKSRWLRLEYLIILLAILVRFIPGPRTIDDAYITFRYSQNLLNGYGLVYNIGEPILGTTTPLYTLLLSVVALFFGGSQAPYPIVALSINALSDGITCLILYRLGRNWGFPVAGGLTSLLWAFSPMSVTFAIGGMETSFNILLLMGSLYMYSTRRPLATALLAAFSLITRPDTLIAYLPLLIGRLIISLREKSHRITLKEILIFFIPLSLWVVIGFAFYGSPIPQSVTAKTVAYSLPDDAALIRLLQHYATPFQGNLVFGRFYIAFGLLIFPALSILGWRRVLRTQPENWPLAIFPLSYFIVFSIANPLIFRWYLAPPYPLYLLGMFIGLESLAKSIQRNRLTYVVGIFCLALTLNAWSLQLDHGPGRPAPRMAFIKLEELYMQAVADLNAQLRPGETIAAGDIGVVGYFSQAKILDTVGLISPQTAAYFPLPPEQYVINYAMPTNLILDFEPEYLILLEVYGRRTLLLDDSFQRMYTLETEYPTDIYGSQAMLVFQRRK